MHRDGRHVPLSQQAYERIRRKIVSLEIPPGSVIDEAELRTQLELGRTPIREALQRLAREKLVNIIPRRGMFVTEIGITDLNRLFEVRISLESTAARLAAQRGTESHWDEMENVLADLPDNGDPESNHALISMDEACHEIIYEAADNEFLYDMLATLYALSLRLWYFSLSKVHSMEAAVAEHKLILDALRQGDADLAAELMEKHIHRFQEEIQAVMLGNH